MSIEEQRRTMVVTRVVAGSLSMTEVTTSHVGTILSTELAHRTHSDQECRSAIVIFGRFDHWL